MTRDPIPKARARLPASPSSGTTAKVTYRETKFLRLLGPAAILGDLIAVWWRVSGAAAGVTFWRRITRT
jgi:hypothetical protein